MRVLIALAILFPGVAGAFAVYETDQSRPYEVVPAEAGLEEEHFFLGELTGHPIMYEVVAEEPFTFTAQISQLANRETAPFSLLLVRQNDRGGGVREVTRMTVDPSEWSTNRNAEAGLSLTSSPLVAEAVESGTYRLEVSTPENAGKYLLQIGDQPDTTGYWDSLANARSVQRWFGYGILAMLGSSLVYQPLGILLLLFLIYKTWQYRQSVRSAPESEPANGTA